MESCNSESLSGSSDKQPSDEQPSDEQPSYKQHSDKEPFDEQPSYKQHSDKEPFDEQPSDEQPSDEQPSNKQQSMDIYKKKHILECFKLNGCYKEVFENALSKFTKPGIAFDFFKSCIEGAEQNVHEECSSVYFDNITKWLELLKENKLNENCHYEAAAFLNEFANNDDHPDPCELNGIDMKEIYEFLTRALLGQPQLELSTSSADFLSYEFNCLIASAKSKEGDFETRKIKQRLLNNINRLLYSSPLRLPTISIDPLYIQNVED